MSINWSRFPSVLSVLFLCALCATSSLSSFGADLFENKIVAKGKGFVIKESDLEEAFIGHKAAAAAMGQPMPGSLDRRLEVQILEKMIATTLMIAKANPSDREEG